MTCSVKQQQARSHNHLMYRAAKERNQLKMILNDMRKHPTVTPEAIDAGERLLNDFQEFFIVLGQRRKPDGS